MHRSFWSHRHVWRGNEWHTWLFQVEVESVILWKGVVVALLIFQLHAVVMVVVLAAFLVMVVMVAMVI